MFYPGKDFSLQNLLPKLVGGLVHVDLLDMIASSCIKGHMFLLHDVFVDVKFQNNSCCIKSLLCGVKCLIELMHIMYRCTII